MDSSKKHEICKEMCNIVDISCRILLQKSLPNEILKMIYHKLLKIKNIHRLKPTIEDDYNIISKGNVKKKWKSKNYETGFTKFRIKRAFSNGR